MIDQRKLKELLNHESITSLQLKDLELSYYDINKLIAEKKLRRVKKGNYEVIKCKVTTDLILKNILKKGDLEVINNMIYMFLEYHNRLDLQELVTKAAYCLYQDIDQDPEQFKSLLEDLSDENIVFYNFYLSTEIKKLIDYNDLEKLKIYADLALFCNRNNDLGLTENQKGLLSYINEATPSLVKLYSYIKGSIENGQNQQVKKYVDLYLESCNMSDFIPFTNKLIRLSNKNNNLICDFFVNCSEEKLGKWAQEYYDNAIIYYTTKKYNNALDFLGLVEELKTLGYGTIELKDLEELKNRIDHLNNYTSKFNEIKDRIKLYIKRKDINSLKEYIYQLLNENDLIIYYEIVLKLINIYCIDKTQNIIYNFVSHIFQNNINTLEDTYLNNFYSNYQNNNYEIAVIYSDIIKELYRLGNFNSAKINEIINISNDDSDLIRLGLLSALQKGNRVFSNYYIKRFLSKKDKVAYIPVFNELINHYSIKSVVKYVSDPDTFNFEYFVKGVLLIFYYNIDNNVHSTKQKVRYNIINILLAHNLIPEEEIDNVLKYTTLFECRNNKKQSEYKDSNEKEQIKIDPTKYISALNYFNETNESLENISIHFEFNKEEDLIFKLFLARLLYENNFEEQGNKLYKKVNSSDEKTPIVNHLLQDILKNKSLYLKGNNQSIVLKRII